MGEAIKELNEFIINNPGILPIIELMLIFISMIAIVVYTIVTFNMARSTQEQARIALEQTRSSEAQLRLSEKQLKSLIKQTEEMIKQSKTGIATEIFRTNLEISKILINSNSVSDKRKLFNEIYLMPDSSVIEGINKDKFDEKEIEIGAFIMLNISYFEFIFGAQKYNALDQEEWSAWIPVIKYFFVSDRVKKVWEERKGNFQEDFVGFVEENALQQL